MQEKSHSTSRAKAFALFLARMHACYVHTHTEKDTRMCIQRYTAATMASLNIHAQKHTHMYIHTRIHFMNFTIGHCVYRNRSYTHKHTKMLIHTHSH
jgi:hypothetical protein